MLICKHIRLFSTGMIWLTEIHKFNQPQYLISQNISQKLNTRGFGVLGFWGFGSNKNKKICFRNSLTFRFLAIHFLKDRVCSLIFISKLSNIYAHVATNGVDFRLDQQI